MVQFFVPTFDIVSCVSCQSGCTHRKLNTELFLHYFRRFQRSSCFTCHSPCRSSSNCGMRKGAFHVQRHRKIPGVLISPPHVSGMTINHLDVAVCLQHIYGLAETLVATTAKVKADGDKAFLVSRSCRHLIVCFSIWRSHCLSCCGRLGSSYRRYWRQRSVKDQVI